MRFVGCLELPKLAPELMFSSSSQLAPELMFSSSSQYRISRLFVDKSSTVISRGFQLRHIPSGKVCQVEVYLHEIAQYVYI